MKISHKFLVSSYLLLGVTVAPSQVLATPFVPQGPFVAPGAGDNIPGPKNVPGKEYSNRSDKDAQQPPVADPEQNLYWDGNGGRQDTFDYSGSRPGDTAPASQREVDAIANHLDALFLEVINNRAALLFSTGSIQIPGNPAYQIGEKEKSVLYESITTTPPAQGGVWATPQQIDADGVDDLDGLEVWGPGFADPIADDADMYSLLGDPLINGTRTSVWYYDPTIPLSTSYITALQIATAINNPNLANTIDLDGLMVHDRGVTGVWDDSDTILFSVMPVDLDGDGVITPNVNGGDIDGGEIWSWQRGQLLAQFLNHGGHLWDTAFNVRATFGTVNENIDALEAVATPEPSSLLGLITLGTLGAGATLKRKLKLAQSTEK